MPSKTRGTCWRPSAQARAGRGGLPRGPGALARRRDRQGPPGGDAGPGRGLNNLGDAGSSDTGRPEAVAVFHQRAAIFTKLAARPAATIKDRYSLAISEYNLGETLFEA